MATAKEAFASVADFDNETMNGFGPPTFNAFVPLQTARLPELSQNPPTEYSYGSLNRQKLDVYLPSLKAGEQAPVFVFIYGSLLFVLALKHSNTLRFRRRSSSWREARPSASFVSKRRPILR